MAETRQVSFGQPAKRRLAEGSYDLVSLTDSEAEQQMPGSTAASVPSTMDPANIHKDGLSTAPSDGRWLRQAEANGRGNARTCEGEGANDPCQMTAKTRKLWKTSPKRQMRTALCLSFLFVCFVSLGIFSFFIHCEMPSHLGNWDVSLSHAASVNHLMMYDVDSDHIPDCVMAYTTDDSIDADSFCRNGRGVKAPCGAVLVLHGFDGSETWHSTLPGEPSAVSCSPSSDVIRPKPPFCLALGEQGQVWALKHRNGREAWSVEPGVDVVGPCQILWLPDLDEDRSHDVLLLWQLMNDTSTSARLALVSGFSGVLIGKPVRLEVNNVPEQKLLPPALHIMNDEMPLILLASGSGVKAIALRDLYRLALGPQAEFPKPLRKASTDWTTMTNISTDLQSIYSPTSGPLRMLGQVPNERLPAAVVMLTDKELMLLNGQNLQMSWKTPIPNISSLPLYGQFNDDGVPDLFVQAQNNNGFKTVYLLDGAIGVELWHLEIPILDLPTEQDTAAALSTRSHGTAFLFWAGKTKSIGSQSMMRSSESESAQNLYLVLAQQSEVLIRLATSNGTITHQAVGYWPRQKDASLAFCSRPSKPGLTFLISQSRLREALSNAVVYLSPSGDNVTKVDMEDVRFLESSSLFSG
uniref:FAM234A/B beta-propeller domain-containing protein n=1 Tax=Eptatretus burgeri TaxID=7764 RepID=A0A8C4PYQ6_EPTBU